MSKNAENLVWKRSRAKGSNLLVLLKIADMADDDGRNAFIGLEALGEATRLKDRGLRYILSSLVEDGELVIERNTDGRAIQVNRRVFKPYWFLHVRCVAEWEAYEHEVPAKIAGRKGRGRGQSTPANFAGPEPTAETGKDCDADCTGVRDERHTGATHIRNNPLLNPGDQTKAGAAPRPLPPADDPDANVGVITKLVHETFDLLGVKADASDVREAVKAQCARLGVAYSSPVVARAYESALFQRQRRRPA